MAQDDTAHVNLTVKADDPWQYIKLPDESYLRLPADMPEDKVKLAVNMTLAHNPDATLTPSEKAGPAQTPEGGSVGRFIGGVWKNLNPVMGMMGLANAIAHPQVTATGALADMAAERAKAVEDAKQGHDWEARGHMLAGAIPFVGPAAARAGERIATGDVAGGVGEATGLLAPAVAPAVKAGVQAGVQGAARAVVAAAPEFSQRVADRMDRMANDRITRVIAPRVGANKTRFTNMAQDVAPTIARETNALSRGNTYEQVSNQLQDVEAQFDAAHDARFQSGAVDPSNSGSASTRKFAGASLLDSLKAKRDALIYKAQEASKFPGEKTNLNSSGQETIKTETQGQPYGENSTVPAYRERADKIQEAIDIIEKGGATTTYDNLKLLRQGYDQEAKPVYSPSMTADYMAKLGKAQGAADITGSIRDFLGKLDPAQAQLNARYSLLRTAHDVLRAAEEVELTRPTIGRTMLARGLGATVGASESGPTGAIVGALTGPLVERIANGAAPATQLMAARQLAAMADALRAGQATRAGNALLALKNLAATIKEQALSTKSKANIIGNAIEQQGQPAEGPQ